MPIVMNVVLALVAAFFLFVFYVIARLGPRQLDARELAQGMTIRRATRDQPDRGWQNLGSKTTARGLDLRFDHNDDPEARASFFADRPVEDRKTMGNIVKVTLPADFETFHVHSRGCVFRVRLRGTDPVIGREIRIAAHVRWDGTPVGGCVENDNESPAAVGGWIEFESLELLRVRR